MSSADYRQGMRFYNFTPVVLVHIDCAPAKIVSISGSTVDFIDDAGAHHRIDLADCARIQVCLRKRGEFPPGDTLDWGALADSVPEFSSLALPLQPVVGLRGAIDEPPWFQFLDRHRTQFEFRDYDHIQNALLVPLARAGAWYTWDAS